MKYQLGPAAQRRLANWFIGNAAGDYFDSLISRDLRRNRRVNERQAAELVATDLAVLLEPRNESTTNETGSACDENPHA